MILMRGSTQSNWLHSIPKRTTKKKTSLDADADADGRINLTFRKALIPAGTENYYRYNVGRGETWRWSEELREMRHVDVER